MNINIDNHEYNFWISKKWRWNRSNQKKCIFAKNWTLLYIHTKLKRIYAPYWLKKWYTAYFKLDIKILGVLRFFWFHVSTEAGFVEIRQIHILRFYIKYLPHSVYLIISYVFSNNSNFYYFFRHAISLQSCYDIKYLNYFSAKNTNFRT